MKKITISIEEDIFNFLKSQQTNISAYINATIKTRLLNKSMTGHTNLETELPKELEEIFNERTT